MIGDDQVMFGPFGARRVTYADYTASARALDFLEDVIRDEVLPRYANTHTESSGTGLQTTRLREDARRIIHEAVGADDDTCVIFCGSGLDRRRRQADRHPRPAPAVAARGSLPARRSTSRRRSAPSSSWARSSTTRTSSPGGRRSPTSSRSRRTPTVTSTSTRSRRSSSGTASGPSRSARSRPPPT